VYSSACVLAGHSVLREWRLQQQPEGRGRVKLGMLSMDWDAFDGIRKKNFAAAPVVHRAVPMAHRVAPISVSIVLGHASANAVKAISGAGPLVAPRV